jgi:hypothetical protein
MILTKRKNREFISSQEVKEAIKTTWYVLFDNQKDYTKGELLTEFVKDLKKELGL